MINNIRKFTVLWSVIILLGNLLIPQKPPEYHFYDTTLPIEERVNDLIGRLTLEEKAGMMLHNSKAIPRLGIPEYNWWNECLHGVARAGKATVFPQAIGIAATFDNHLVQRIATAVSDEARAKFHAAVRMDNRTQYAGLTFWTPNVNIFRDPRWGRGQETYGEDPYLTSRIGTAYVTGLQGNHPQYLKTAACAKHFAVHSGPEPLRHYFNAVVDTKDLRETYLPAFKALVDAGVEAVMCAYNRTNGAPCCGSQSLLVDILRNQWGFHGHIVTDCWALDDIWLRHKVVKTKIEAAAMAINNGVNLNCGYLYKFLPDTVKKGLVKEVTIDECLATLLTTRFKLGLFDPDSMNPYSRIPESIVNCQKHKNLAREAAAKSIVLLQNKNNVLPLDKNIKHLYVTGPNAADVDVLMGNYNGMSGEMATVLEGVTEAVSPATMVEYRPGCLLNGKPVFSGTGMAAANDATIAVIGLSPLLEGEDGDAMLSESNGDRVDIRLPGNQVEFIRKLRENNDKPLVVVIFGGSAVAVPEIANLADAVLFAWYPGEQGGNALADVIFGTVNPAGRLPVTVYRSLKDLPPYEDYSMQGRTYRYFQGKPLYPFGFGLSYTTFQYDGLQVGKPELSASSLREITITASIKNTGHRDGEEVVQLYTRYKGGAFQNLKNSRFPIKELKGYNRIHLQKGEQKEIRFILNADALKTWVVKKNKWVLLPGEYEIMLASSSSDIRLRHTIDIKK
jgi:beta-glucosidase